MSSIDNAVLPKGSRILVTGANGFIASHLVEQLLELGYKVRGTTRSAHKLDNLKKRWDDKYPGLFEVAEVADIKKERAYDEAIKDVAGVAHVASNVSWSTNYDEVVSDAVDGTLEALRAASKAPSVKRFVLTSSVAAVGFEAKEGGGKLGKDDYHYSVIKLAKSIPDDQAAAKGGATYAASKTEGELAAWKFVKENKPSFTFNSVLPAFCLGEILDNQSQAGSTAGWTKDFFIGKSDHVRSTVPSVEIVSVRDIAALHVGALLLPNVENERLIGSRQPQSWNSILSLFRKHYPNKKFYEDGESIEVPTETIYDLESSLKVLEQLNSGQKREFVDVETALLETIKPFA